MRRQSLKRRAALDAAQPAIKAMRERVGTRCEWCNRHRELEDHHVARGSDRNKTLDGRLVLRLCRPCHDTIEEMKGEHQRAIGLALLYHAGRDDLELFYRITDRLWPARELVELWIKRLTRRTE
jgi:hypothetical protein